MEKMSKAGGRAKRTEAQEPLAFVDLFAGSGGFSLGLRQAGLRGLFAVEKHPDAFRTFQANLLLGETEVRFHWPSWLEKKAWSIQKLLASHRRDLLKLRGAVHVVAGGPPCQGFSFAGRRQKNDSRNALFKRYVEFVSIVKPGFVILENVPGMKVPHGTKARSQKSRPGPKPKSYLTRVRDALGDAGYSCRAFILDPANFGVPQCRPRIVVVGMRWDLEKASHGGLDNVWAFIETARREQLSDLGLGEVVTAKQAISDLETADRKLVPCDDRESPKGFLTATYRGPRSAYQKLMHGDGEGPVLDSNRLARHSKPVAKRFSRIISSCRQGVRMNEKDRKRFGLLKHRIFPMAPNQPAPTLTTLPDDVLHYSEPRILTVRECARIQSFPDWFRFLGPYTTGGNRRRRGCPRYTQVGNAVPPLFARALGIALARLFRTCTNKKALPPQATHTVPVDNLVEA